MLTARPRGTADILPGEVGKWHALEAIVRQVCAVFGYHELRTPIFEHTELFGRGVGETTDIVEKEMYTFYDRGNRSITLRPEATAPVARAFVENKLFAQPLPVKVYYLGPMFRYGRPQTGRLRQFHQFGVEAIGSDDPAIDAEVISLAMNFYREIGLKDVVLYLNSVGCPVCRLEYRSKLVNFLYSDLGALCETCQARYYRNPLRIFDCKSPTCQGVIKQAPTITKNICPRCDESFAKVQKYLDIVGTNYIVDEKMVRGLDYYTRTTFEIVAQGIGAQNSIGGGGRYDGLVEQCGGPPSPGIGFALGLERIILALDQQGIELRINDVSRVFVAVVDPVADNKAFELLISLRQAGISTEKDFMSRSLKAQLKYADKIAARFVLFLGGEELTKSIVPVRDMSTGEQKDVPLAELLDYLKRHI
ncbi:MAG: histidine--tRNA ligase [Syntrophomonadaceae bacterium]|nr:histidine--tRNA ligase [Syntrophomonadaceae bacterium]